MKTETPSNRALRALRLLKSGVFYLAGFGVARGMLFISPIVLANLLPRNSYGAVEWAQSASLLLSAVLTLGLGNVVPLVLHGRASHLNEKVVAKVFLAAIATWTSILSLIALAVGHSWLYMVLVFTPIIACQNFLSIVEKSHGRRFTSLMIDAGFFGTLALVAVVLAFFGQTHENALLTAGGLALCGYGIILLTPIIRISQGVGAFSMDAVLALVKLSLPLMAASLISMTALASGRFGLGLVGSADLVAEYSGLYRVAFLPMIAHQIILTGIFVSAYRVDSVKLDRTIMFIPMAVGITSLLFWTVLRWLAPLFGEFFEELLEQHRQVGALLVSQMVLVSAISMNEIIASRELVTSRVVPVTGLVFLLLAASALFYISIHGTTLLRYTAIHWALLFVFYLSQVAAMRRAGVKQTWTAMTSVAGSLGVLLVLLTTA